MKRLIPSLPDTPDLGNVFKAFPGLVPDILHLNDTIMCDEAVVHQGGRELIAAYVSALNACQYCTGAHMNAAEAFGVGPAVVTALLKDVETAAAEEALKPMLLYV